jgi:hypothetical protein
MKKADKRMPFVSRDARLLLDSRVPALLRQLRDVVDGLE